MPIRRKKFNVRRIAVRLAVIVTVLSFVRQSLSGAEVPAAVRMAEQQRIAAIERASRSTLAIFSSDGQGGGSGVVISPDGYALTNFHVTMPCGDHMRCGINDGKLYDAVIVGIDPTGDVALIKLLGRDDFPAAELGDSDQVRAGDWCMVIGNPFLLATNLQPSVSYGIVSGVHRYQPPAGTLLEYADCIQTDAAINPGNSGGPLFDAEGRLIGINGRGSFEKRGRVNVGVGYAISINQIKNFMGQLRSGRIVDHATLGATVITNPEGRVVVANILRNSDAYRRGLREDDELVAFGGRPITTVNGFKNALGIFPKGWRVPLSYRREGERFDIFVRLAGVHSADELLEKIRTTPAPEPPNPKGPLPQDENERNKGPDQPRSDDSDEPKSPKIPGQQPPRGRPNQPHNAPSIPAPVLPLIKQRKGFANYYFNELNRERIWSAFQARGNFQTAKEEWTIQGTSHKRERVEIRLAGESSQISIAGTEFKLDARRGLQDQSDPPGSGGLLMALHVWRRLLVMGPKEYGDVVYLGTLPISPQGELVEAFEGTFDVSETRYWFDRTNGQMMGLELSADVGVDPCEVHFSDYREVGSRFLPHKIVVRHGDLEFMRIECQKYAIP